MIDLGSVLAGKVPVQRIEMIPEDRIDDDPRNGSIYQLSGLDGLADNIALVGLQQPLRVRENPADPRRVIIVSGHRRRAAIRKLIAEGREDLREIPCIRETETASPELQELRLIYANSDTRKMTPPEIGAQIERVTELLYTLKEQGMEFPGRMRDHVAQACKISKSKISRLAVIKKGLAPSWQKEWKAGKIPESTAYTLAQMLPAYQDLIHSGAVVQKKGLRYLYESDVTRHGKALEAIWASTCDLDGGNLCSHREVRQKHSVDIQNPWDIKCAKCCAECANLSTCRDACPKLASKAAEIRAERKREAAADREASVKRQMANAAQIAGIWDRTGIAREKAAVSVADVRIAMGFSCNDRDRIKEWEAREDGMTNFTEATIFPWGFEVSLNGVKALVTLADTLRCSVDFLLGRESPAGGTTVPESGTDSPTWHPGTETPEKRMQDAYAIGDDGDADAVMWDGEHWCYPGLPGCVYPFDVVKWYPIPVDKDEKEG